MGARLIFFIIFTLFSCIILTNQSLPWYSLRSGFQCDTKMAAVFSCMRSHGTKYFCASQLGDWRTAFHRNMQIRDTKLGRVTAKSCMS